MMPSNFVISANTEMGAFAKTVSLRMVMVWAGGAGRHEGVVQGRSRRGRSRLQPPAAAEQARWLVPRTKTRAARPAGVPQPSQGSSTWGCRTQGCTPHAEHTYGEGREGCAVGPIRGWLSCRAGATARRARAVRERRRCECELLSARSFTRSLSRSARSMRRRSRWAGPRSPLQGKLRPSRLGAGTGARRASSDPWQETGMPYCTDTAPREGTT